MASANALRSGTVGYVCKYTPLELLVAFGLEPELMDGQEADFEQAETLTHANLCSHAKAVIQQASGFDALVLTDCCDSVRRTFDVLDEEGRLELLEMVDLPHEAAGCSVERFAAELARLARELAIRTGRPFNGSRFAAACRAAHDDSQGLGAVTEPFLALLGARVPGEMAESIRQSLSLPVMDLTCGGNRHLEEMPQDVAPLAEALGVESAALPEVFGAEAASRQGDQAQTACGNGNDPSAADGSGCVEGEAVLLSLGNLPQGASGQPSVFESPLESETFAQLMRWYAGALLRMVPCMRMTDVAGRRQLTEHPQLRGVVYSTVKFCDYYGFDYERLRTSCPLPLLKIETDYTPMPQGQLSTRLQAFEEALPKEDPMAADSRIPSSLNGSKGSIGASASVRAKAKGAKGMPADGDIRIAHPEGRYVAGIDSGSTTTNMVALDGEGAVVASAIVRTGPKAQVGAHAAFGAVLESLGARPEDFKAIVATGYGRFNIPFANGTKTEITCHAKGAHALNPAIRTIVDIGGQDSKVICLDAGGAVENFIMNDKCAAGTGRFLEAMARTLEVSLDEMSAAGLTWKKDLSISSMCTVFAESEVISLIADNHSEADIVHGLNKSIAARTASMVSRAKGRPPYMMTGGVARNRGVVQQLEAKLGEPLFIAENPDLCGALGASLFALEAAK